MTCLPGIERRGFLSGGRAGPPRFSASVLHNQLVYVAGQIASDASQDYAGQARQVLHLVEECLTAAGTSKAQLLKVNVFLRSIDEGADSFNAVWDSWVARDNLPVGGWVVLHQLL